MAPVAIHNGHATNGHAEPKLAPLQASKLVVNLSKELKPLPKLEDMKFGDLKSDHMLVVNYNPRTGWSAPEIKPYGPISLDPASSCFQYCTNVFEGMKAYIGPDGEARLFRPTKNMERLASSAERVALPPFDPSELLELIRRLVAIEKRWIPDVPGYSLYLRPTIIGTRDSLGVTASDSCMIYVICTPAGPYFKSEAKGIPLLAVGQTVRSWPGGTGGYKLGANYVSGFLPQRAAAKEGYAQILWLLGDKITEAGAMNFFIATKREDGDLDVITPALDGTILPGVTRDSCLALLNAHTSGKCTLPGLPADLKIHTHERDLTMPEVVQLSEEGKLVESFAVGTAVIVAPIGRVGWEGKDIVFPNEEKGLGMIGKALWRRITDVQMGRDNYEDWSVVCH